MKLKKIENISNEELTKYKSVKSATNVRRRKILKDGYTDIVFATDSDLD